jgi:hypothetical protein
MGAIVRLVPDIGEGLVAMTGAVETMLRALAATEADERLSGLPLVLAHGVALRVFGRVGRAVVGTQTRIADSGGLRRPRPGPGSGRWVSADRERDLVPLRPVVVAVDDLDLLQQAACALGKCVAAGPGSPVFTAVHATASAGAVSQSDPHALVAMLARFAGLLDLAVSTDGKAIRGRLRLAADGEEIVLNPSDEAAHARELTRMMRMIAG